MERRVRGNFHARCEVGENLEITSKSYLSQQSAYPAYTYGGAGVVHIIQNTKLPMVTGLILQPTACNM